MLLNLPFNGTPVCYTIKTYKPGYVNIDVSMPGVKF